MLPAAEDTDSHSRGVSLMSGDTSLGCVIPWGSPPRLVAGFGEPARDLDELDVGVLGGADEHPECLFAGDAKPLQARSIS